jgi:hypothetical protein
MALLVCATQGPHAGAYVYVRGLWEGEAHIVLSRVHALEWLVQSIAYMPRLQKLPERQHAQVLTCWACDRAHAGSGTSNTHASGAKKQKNRCQVAGFVAVCCSSAVQSKRGGRSAGPQARLSCVPAITEPPCLVFHPCPQTLRTQEAARKLAAQQQAHSRARHAAANVAGQRFKKLSKVAAQALRVLGARRVHARAVQQQYSGRHEAPEPQRKAQKNSKKTRTAHAGCHSPGWPLLHTK